MNLPSWQCRIQNGGGGTTLQHLAPLLPGIQFEVMCSRSIKCFSYAPFIEESAGVWMEKPDASNSLLCLAFISRPLSLLHLEAG